MTCFDNIIQKISTLKSKIFVLIFLFSLIACENSKNQNRKYKSENVSNSNQSIDTTGFLQGCQSWVTLFSGYLQGVNTTKDSLGLYCFYECYTCKETFQLIFIHNTIVGPDPNNTIWDEFTKGCSNQYSNFRCFSFLYPMRDPDKQKNIHDSNIYFPIQIKGYERIEGDKWKFVKEITAKSFEELSSFQFNIIHHLNN